MKELHTDIGTPYPSAHGHLGHWADQGVLLLNSVLTVESGKPGSHANIGWELFTDAVIDHLSQGKQGLVFMLWGKYAAAKASRISSGHCVLTAAHPSPLSAYRGFLGCRHFSKANAWLKAHGQKEINW
jgi:uracil-DNA glycosylase